MNFIIGDEVGLVKEITITEINKIPKQEIKRWGQIDRKREVLRMCINTGKPINTVINGTQFSVARKDGSVQVMSTLDGSIIKDIKVYTPATIDNKKSRKISNNLKAEQFIGINCHDGIIYACTDLGKLFIIDTNVNDSELIIKSVNLNQQNLWCMKMHPKQHNIIATGGEERELCIWDLDKIKKDEEDENLLKIEPIFTAKNVKHDFLNLRVPVWVTCIQWLDEDDITKIVIGTGHHHIRVYDTKKARRPILSVEHGEYPIRSIALNKDKTQVIFSDTYGSVNVVDINNGKLIGSFKGFSGSVSDLWSNPEKDILATVSLDRHLRVFSTLGKRQLLHKVYLKQRINCVMGDLSFVDPSEKEEVKEEEEDEEQEEDVWETMEQIDEESQKKTKKRKLNEKHTQNKKSK